MTSSGVETAEWKVNPLHSKSDQHQTSLWNINAFSVREAMRIKDMITEHEFRW